MNAYINLISSKRSINSFNAEARFHMFDSLFFFKLTHLIENESYNFLQHFGSFMDKRMLNSKANQVLTPHSVLLFLINNEDHDYALLAVDILSKKLILYDCVGGGRAKDTFALQVKKIRRFLIDYFVYMSVKMTATESSPSISSQADPIDCINIRSNQSFKEGGESLKHELFLD